jgi:hypothetical protein
MDFMPYIFLFFLILATSLRAEKTTSEHNPMYAGTLLAFYPQNAAPGRLSVEPYLFAIKKYGFYTEGWTPPKGKYIDQLDLLLTLETGITDHIDFTLDLNGTYSHFGNRHTWVYGDTTAFLGFQILRDQKKTPLPDFRILIGETFPTGKYEHLNPDKNGSDILGNGTYATTLLLVLAKTFYWAPKHPLNANLNLYYIISSPAKVHGFNCYGGASDTRGHVKPGDQFITNIAIQYSLNRRLAIGTDLHYFHQNRSHFSGEKGILMGLPPTMASPPLSNLALPPASNIAGVKTSA